MRRRRANVAQCGQFELFPAAANESRPAPLPEHPPEALLSAAAESDMTPSLLEHYTSLAQHHREKLSFLAGTYLVLGQILILTPRAAFDLFKDNLLAPDQFVPDIVIFGAAAAGLFTMITIGILHHLCNLIAYATLRLDYERRCLIAEARRHPPEAWEVRLAARLRSRLSLSKVSAALAIVCAGAIWGAIALRINYLVRHLGGDTGTAAMLVGAFLIVQIAIVAGYAAVVLRRARLFYHARDLLKCIETDAPRMELVSCLRRCDIDIGHDEAERYVAALTRGREEPPAAIPPSRRNETCPTY